MRNIVKTYLKIKYLPKCFDGNIIGRFPQEKKSKVKEICILSMVFQVLFSMFHLFFSFFNAIESLLGLLTLDRECLNFQIQRIIFIASILMTI